MKSSDDTESGELDRTRNRISELCEQGLAKRSYYLLSSLGLQLGGKDLATIKQTGLKLAEFIQTYLSDKFRVVPVAGHPAVRAVVSAASGLQEAHIAPSEELSPVEPRYHYRFWAAFSVPPKGRRYLDPEEFVFRDLEAVEEPPPGWLKIDDELIAPTEVTNRDELIKRNIRKWLSHQELEAASFWQTPKRRASEKNSLLAALVDALDRRQLENTHMSLDVVAALLRKQV